MSNLGNLGIPNPQLPVGVAPDGKGGTVPVRLSDLWYRFLTRLSQLSAESALRDVSVGASPWSFTADTIGHLNLIGGTISQVLLTRGSNSTVVTGSRLVPVAAGDVVTTTYTVAPTASFIPGARA